MSTHPPQEIIDLSVEQREALLGRAAEGELSADDLQVIRAIFESYAYVTDLIDHKNTTLARLRKWLFGASTEKTASLVGPGGAVEPAPPPPAAAGPEQPSGSDVPRSRPAGHGRHGADDYPGADRVPVSHAGLHAGDPCPLCHRGTVYELAEPGVLIRFRGQPPVQTTIYELQKLRCQLCGHVFTAAAPPGIGEAKYDPTVASMIGLLKYGSGLPFNRVERLEGDMGIPLPASTQWEIVACAVPPLQLAYDELIRQAAQGEVLHNDDTVVKILQRLGVGAAPPAAPEGESHTAPSGSAGPRRTGQYTSGVVALREDHRIALFFSGQQHAGENLSDVLRRRAQELPPPIQMCDALSRNVPTKFQTILAHCLAHARRQFVDVHERFPTECQYVLERLATVYGHDATAKQRRLTPAERLQFHQAESGPTMAQLRDWLRRQVEEKLVEPNSGLGEAIAYLRKHWDTLTLFLRVPGAPLDNNLCERALKKAILHRKNSLFYRTPRGALVGDIYMSLIHTCELCGTNPFDYLTDLQRHAAKVAVAPEHWLPWNYREQLAG